MRVYLDNSCLNRPFDDQSQVRVRLEAEAKLEIQQRIKNGTIELAWSYMLDIENTANPSGDRCSAIAVWKDEAVVDIEESAAILQRAHEIAGRGAHTKDAIHVACALAASCDFFITTDDRILKVMAGFTGIGTVGPAQFVIEVE
jgi:hypothetical protein